MEPCSIICGAGVFVWILGLLVKFLKDISGKKVEGSKKERKEKREEADEIKAKENKTKQTEIRKKAKQEPGGLIKHIYKRL